MKLNMNYSQLNEYLNNIIKVVNQHAKLLQTLNHEVQHRTTEKQLGELFNLIANGLPYDQLLKKLGGVPPTRRGSVMKLLGDASFTNIAEEKEQFAMLEGSERLLKATEMIGKYLMDMKEYSHSSECKMGQMESEIGQRITKGEYHMLAREKSKKLKNKLRAVLSQYEEKVTVLDTKTSS